MSPATLKAELLYRDKCVIGEGPCWHDERLWWVDIERGFLLSVDGAGNACRRIALGQRVGVAVPTHDGAFLVALEQEIVRVDLHSERRQTVTCPPDFPPHNRFNDGKCDPSGRLVVGTTSLRSDQQTSVLYSLDGNGSLHRLRGNVSISNGLAWSADGGTMYYIDTPELCVFAFDYHLATGAISNERIVLRFSENDGWPDGMTIDREGRLWIGFWDGWTVRCYQPATGSCEAVVEIPCARPTSCCFGGPGLDHLYITSARTGLTEDQLRQQPWAGSIFVCDPRTSGFPTRCFDASHVPGVGPVTLLNPRGSANP